MTILVADRDQRATHALRAMLEKGGWIMRAVFDPAELAAYPPGPETSLVLADPAFGRVEGAPVIDWLQKKGRANLPIVLLYEEGKKGGADTDEGSYLAKPYHEDNVLALVSGFLKPAGPDLKDDHLFYGMIGKSAPMRRLFETLEAVGPTGATILITGETGTGKELAARAIHRLSDRRYRRFVAVNCGALPESLIEAELFGHVKGAFTGAETGRMGKFEYASGGTLFLDEIGELTPSAQTKLLTAIETAEIQRIGGNQTIRTDVRILCATNRDLGEAVSSGLFREDLFYRINVIPVTLPPLRERTEDIPLLIRLFVERYHLLHRRPARSMAPEAMARLLGRRWPGNVRELEKMVERLVILAKGEIIGETLLDTPPALSGAANQVEDYSSLPYREMIRRALLPHERRYFIALLEKYRGAVAKAARAAELDRKTFYQKLADLDLDPARFRKKRDRDR